jgi:hypothetical protein
MAAVSITLKAGSNPPALRYMLQQYDERCRRELAALLTKHATLTARGVALPATSQRDQEYAAAAACSKTNMAALQVLLRLDATPAGIVSAKALPVDDSEQDTSLSLYDDLEQVLLHVARDWDNGDGTLIAERARVTQALTRLVLPTAEYGAPRRRVLVTGSGLGRMSFDLCQHGYNVDAVDASLAMTLAAATMSDHAAAAHTLQCHPWLLRTANLRDTAMRFRAVNAPGPLQPPAPAQAPATRLSKGLKLDEDRKMSSHEVDGCESAAPQLHFRHGRFPGPAEMPEPQTHDCVVSHFYIDAVLQDLTIVVDAVSRALKIGGIWLCLGPLKWQQTPGRPASSYYSWSEVLLLVEAAGFELITAVRT